jgi:anti-sigma factor ChrR (cupin superfamily)
MSAEGALRIARSRLFGPAQDFADYPWQPFSPGVEIARLYGTGEHGPAAALLRYAPGAAVPRHAHVDYEHILVLAGSQRDERGLYEAGTLLVHGAGTSHAVASDHGCVVLAIWNAPVLFDGSAP